MRDRLGRLRARLLVAGAVAGSVVVIALPAVTGGSAPTNTAVPVITGTATTGQLLSCSNGSWTGSPSSFAQEWRRGASAISGATSSTYTLQVADEGQNVVCRVTATNGSGSTSADSAAVVPSSASAGTAVANFWVDQNGGTCARQPTAGAYNNTAACPDFDAAYTAASCGDLVGVKGGAAYPSQSIFATQKNCSQYVTFTPAAGETVTIGGAGVGTGGVAMCDADWIKFLGSRTGTTSNFNVVDDGTQGETGDFVMGSGGCQFGLSERVDHVWIEGTSFETYLIRGADQVTLKDNDISSGKSNHYSETIFVSNGYDGSYRDNYATDFHLLDNDIHGFTSELCREGAAGVPAGQGCHVECLTMEAENVYIIGNHVWDCGNSGGIIFSSDQGFMTKGTDNRVWNNMITTQEINALAIGSLESGAVVSVRNNTLHMNGGNAFIAADYADPSQYFGTMHVVGNVINGMAVGCSEMSTFTGNVVKSGGACTTGNTVATTAFAGAYPDFHLAASQSAQDLIPTGAGCPTSVDLDGEARPKGSACDAGADER